MATKRRQKFRRRSKNGCSTGFKRLTSGNATRAATNAKITEASPLTAIGIWGWNELITMGEAGPLLCGDGDIGIGDSDGDIGIGDSDGDGDIGIGVGDGDGDIDIGIAGRLLSKSCVEMIGGRTNDGRGDGMGTS